MLPSIADFLFVILFIYLALPKGGIKLLQDADTGYHVRAGEYILTKHLIPKYDLFSFHYPNLPWTAHEWLSEVVMAIVHGTFGMTGLVIFFAMLIAGFYCLLFRVLLKYSNNIILPLVAVLLAIASSQVHWLARPHIFSFFFVLLWYFCLDYHQHGIEKFIWALPFAMLFWVNLHGGFMAGFILLGAFLVGNIIQAISSDGEARHKAKKRCCQLINITALCIAACLINPFGYHILLFPFNLVGNKFLMDHVSEFISPNFHEPFIFKYHLLFLIALLALTRERARGSDLLLILGFTSMSLYSSRHIPLFAIVTAPVLVRQGDLLLNSCKCRLADFVRDRGKLFFDIAYRAIPLIWPFVVVAAVAYYAANGKIEHRFDATIKPVAATAFLLREPLKGNMFNNDEFGDYIIYAAWPKYRVFFDGRSDMYGVSLMKDYFKVTDVETGWEKVLDSYHIEWIIFDANSVLSRVLLENKDWRLIYADKLANIFVRNTSCNRALISRYSNVRPVPQEKNEIIAERTI